MMLHNTMRGSFAFRVQAPNSSPRDILVVPLDAQSARPAQALSEQAWRNARFVPFGDADGWRSALEARRPDVVVMLATAGQNLSRAIAIGELCLTQGVKISGVLMRPDAMTSAEMSAALRSMRPWTQTLAVIGEADYLPGLLHALGA
jgi:hypothetical protein